MAWNESVKKEYIKMLDGPIGEALYLSTAPDVPPWAVRIFILYYIAQLELGNYNKLKIEPANQKYLTSPEMRTLHIMRVACCLYAERLEVFPWRLKDKSVDDLKPLLSIQYQGFKSYGPEYRPHGAWDVNPGQRMLDSVLHYSLSKLLKAIGLIDKHPETEMEMIYYLLQDMRDSGWVHVSSGFVQYEEYQDHGYGVYDYEIIRDVKRGTCHISSDYLVAMLRSYNIASHLGKGWGIGPPPELQSEWGKLIHHGLHCYMHFSSVKQWFSHGDIIYNMFLMGIPPECSFRSYQWMCDNHFDTTDYEWSRARILIQSFYWCMFLGKYKNTDFDVRYLYYNGLLRNRLETLHIRHNLALCEDAPADIPPLYTDDQIDLLMYWVEKNIIAEMAEPE